MTTESISEQNKKTVLAFYKKAHFDGDVDGAIARYVGDTYIQHTPAAEDGVEGLRAYINGFLTSFPNAKGDIRRVIADGDIVAVHAHWTGLISPNGDVGVDIFRVKDGKLVEHYHDRQMAVLRRRQRMDWLDLPHPEHELLQPLPIGALRIERAITRQAQTVLAL